MSRNGSIRYQIEKTLKSLCRFGESRHEAKKAHTACRYIYSFNTMKTYIRQLNYMVDWAKENDIKITKEDGKTFITCSAIDNGKPFMSVKLLVGDEEQALFIKNRFLNDSGIYSEIIELLTKEK